MTSIDTHSHSNAGDLVITLEGILVKEFRTCRTLQQLVRQERQLLTTADVDALAELVEDKEVLLDELNQIEEQRRLIVEQLAEAYPDIEESPSVSDLLPYLDRAASRRVDRLYTGIGTVIEQIREYNHGNQALALNGLKRVDAVQAYLLDIFQKPGMYQPPGSTPQMAPALVWDVDQRT